MRRLLIASLIGLGLASGSAFAADLPAAAPPEPAASPVVYTPPPPVYSWTGCYINGGLGYGIWKQDHYGEQLTPRAQLTPTVSTGGEDWVATAGAGCDYQVGSRWLIGAFGDYNLLDIVNHYNYGGFFQEPFWDWTGTEKQQYAWAVGGRIGYLVTPKLMTYFGAGYTQAHFNQINLFTDASPSVAPAGCGAGPCFIGAHNVGGWFLSSGVEYALWDIIPVPGLFWRTDYRYSFYNSADLPILTSAGAPLAVPCTAIACGEHMQKDAQMLTTGLVWRFNVGGLSSGSAYAADMPVTGAPGVATSVPPPAPYRWTGCYINGGLGHGIWEQDHADLAGTLQTGSTGGSGWVGTVGGGCDYQIGSHVVFGALADYDLMHLSGSFKDPLSGDIGTQTSNGQWGVGGRLGYLVTPNLLTYITAGYNELGFGQINLSTNTIPSSPTSLYFPAHTYQGWFMGGGTEYALTDVVPVQGLFWRSEYRYSAYYTNHDSLSLLTTAGPSPCPAPASCSLLVDKDVQTITSGLVWRFNFERFNLGRP